MPAIRVVVSGRVQGVGYRDWAVGEARRIGLAGWIRNRTDGTVELLLLGPQAQIDQMVALAASGPRMAQVYRIEQVPADMVDGVAELEGAVFQRRPTA